MNLAYSRSDSEGNTCQGRQSNIPHYMATPKNGAVDNKVIQASKSALNDALVAWLDRSQDARKALEYLLESKSGTCHTGPDHINQRRQDVSDFLEQIQVMGLYGNKKWTFG